MPGAGGHCLCIYGAGMMGSGMQEAMKQYQNALETMSSEAVEYVQGIPS